MNWTHAARINNQICCQHRLPLKSSLLLSWSQYGNIILIHQLAQRKFRDIFRTGRAILSFVQWTPRRRHTWVHQNCFFFWLSQYSYECICHTDWFEYHEFGVAGLAHPPGYHFTWLPWQPVFRIVSACARDSQRYSISQADRYRWLWLPPTDVNEYLSAAIAGCCQENLEGK